MIEVARDAMDYAMKLSIPSNCSVRKSERVKTAARLRMDIGFSGDVPIEFMVELAKLI